MPPTPIYLDHNATAPILPEVADAVRDAALRFLGNPASQHELGRQARRALEAARARIGELLGARTTGMDAEQVIFTSGGTESNNLALHGLLPNAATPSRAPKRAGGFTPPVPRLLISAIEHPSITRTAEHLQALGACSLESIGVDRNGVIQLDSLSKLATRNPQLETHNSQLLSLILASNETGVIQPVAQAASLCHEHGAMIHTDATQAVGKIPVNFRELGVDALTATAHKFHGPLGIGILIVRHGVKLEPALHGGFQQAALRPGTESVALALGMQTALELAHAEAETRRLRFCSLRDQFENAIIAEQPDAVLIGAEAPRLPHTSNISFVGLNRQALAMALDLAGIACSTGSACASGSSEPSPTLVAMGLPEEVISSSLRFSLGATTTLGEIEEAARRILAVCNRLRREK